MLLNTKTDVKRSGMILLIVVAFLSMFLVVGTTYLLVADSIRRTSDFDLNATDKRSDFALMPDIDPRYMLNFALGQILYDIADPVLVGGKVVTTNSALRGHSLATSMYGVYEPQPITKATAGTATVINGKITSIPVVFGGSGYTITAPPRIIIEGGGGSGATAAATVNPINGQVSAINVISQGSNYTSQPTIYIGVPNDRPFQGAGKTIAELGQANYIVNIPSGSLVPVPAIVNPEKGSTPSRWNPPYTYPDRNHLYLGSYTLKSDGTTLPIKPSFFFDNVTNLRPPLPNNPPEFDGYDVKNLEGYPGGNDSIWIDAGFPVMTTSDGRKYKALIAPFILDLDGRINLNVAGNLMQRDAANPNFTADHASNQGWGRWEINPKKLIENYAGGSPPGSPYNPLNITQTPFPSSDPIAPENEFLRLLSFTVPSIENGTTGTAGLPNSTKSAVLNSTFASDNQWRTFGRLYQAKYLPINNNSPPVTNFLTNTPHSYAKVDFNGAGDYQAMGGWGPTAKPTFLNANGFPTFGQGFGNGQSSEHLLDGLTPSSNYHARNYNPYRTQINPVNPIPTDPNLIGVSTVFPVSETASILRWQGKGEPFSKSQLALLLPKSLGLDMPYANVFLAQPPIPPNPLPPLNPDAVFRQRIRNMVTTLSADLDRPAMVPIAPDTLSNPITGAVYSNTFKIRNFIFPDRTVPVPQMMTTYYSPISDTPTILPNQTSPPLKLNLGRLLTPFPAVVQNGMSDQTNFINYTAGPIKAQFDQAANDRQAFAMEIYNLLRNLTGVIFYEIAKNSIDPLVQADIMEIKRSNRWLAQLAANIVDFIDVDDFNTVFNWNTGDAKDIVFGVELPRVVINEAYSMAQNDSTDTFMNNTKATKETHLFTAVELMNPLPTDNFYGVGPGGHNAVLQFKNAAGTEYQNYKLVLCKQGQVSGQMNAVNGNYFNNTGSHDFNMTNIAMDSNNPSMMDPDVMDKAILDNWTDPDPNNLPVANMVPATWYLNAGGFMVISDNTTLRTEANPMIGATFKTPKLKLKIINKDLNPNDDNAPEVMLQKLVYPGLPPNDFDTMTNMLTNGAFPYNPYITVDVFSKRKMWDLRKYDKMDALTPDVTTTNSKGRKSPFLDSIGLDEMTLGNNMFNGNNTVNQVGLLGERHTMGQANSNVQNPLPWLTHLDRQLINPLELIHVSTVKPHEVTQTACRWNDAFNQQSVMANNVPAKISYPYAHNWPWFDENTRLYRFLEAVGVSPLQAGEVMHGRALGKVNVNTMHSEEVFQAVADATVANNFTAAEVTTGYNNLIGQKPIFSFGQANQLANQSALSVKTGLNKSLMGYPDSSNTPYKNFLDNDSPDPMNPLFPSTGTNVATYARKELLTKIGNSVTTKSNVFAVWITTGYFEVIDDSAQPPLLGAEIGKADGINIRHRMFAIVDRTNMSAFTTNLVDSGLQFTNPPPNPPTNLPTTTVPGVGACPNISAGMIVVNWNRTGVNQSGKPWSFSAGMLLTFDPNTDNEETVQLEDVGGGVLGAKFIKNHAGYCTIINRGNPGPWVGYDRTKDREVVPYAEIIE